MAPTTQDRVVLLDEAGGETGTAARAAVHTTDTPLHLAFSSYLVDAAGRVLITRRSLSKVAWPGVWTNSCCGHPRPGEDVADAARRRIRQELGLTVRDLRCALPNFRYRATDVTGIVENELCPVFWGRVDPAELQPDPDEVIEHAWVEWPDLVAAVRATPQVFSPWSVSQVPLLEGGPSLTREPGSRSAGHRTVSEFLGDVDRLLRSEVAELQQRWSELTGGAPAEVLPGHLPDWLSEQLSAGGKRLRIRLVHWGHLAAGGDSEPTAYAQLVRLASALEVLHQFALVHDDVMDQSASRRGRPSAYVEATRAHIAAAGRGGAERFGENLAILLGDLAHSLADQLVDPLPAEQRALWYRLCTELIAGQGADLTGAAAGRRDRAHSEQVARLKSSRYSVERLLELGALAAGAGPAQRAALLECGQHLGRIFALRDDFLGVWGDPELTGKPAGDDLAEAKATVILALATDRLTGAAAEALERLGTRDQRPDDVAVVTEALDAAGIRTEIEEMIAAEVSCCDTLLDTAPLTPAGVAGLRAEVRAIAWRDS
ncbi:isopentenyl-diphosphate delta-isomerase [Enemella dayhoffiae]|uniref:Isopentenyl-diphosphate Delta-isomerase n=1 Tax=Enemella dayhoffiae TaxID=2016507 RepID=A0A255GXV8_9ACTN|nr:isopentenyl-diphosphate delta-isomerase [Enemella dayhoffiae]